MPKTNPYLIPKENTVKTEEVRYLNTEIPSCEEFMKTYEYDEALMASYEAEYEALRQIYGYGPGFGEWFAKVAITTTVGIILGPAAIPVGAAVWGTSKVAEECCDSESDKKVFRFISDCGRDALIGGAIAGVSTIAGGASNSLTKEIFHSSGKKAANLVTKREIINGAREVFEIGSEIYGVSTMGAEAGHELHKSEGKKYEPLCVVCQGIL